MAQNGGKKYSVRGQLVSSSTDEPLAGVCVRVLDKDLFDDDILGSAQTDESGRFEVSFTEEDFATKVTDTLERGPDIYLIVEAPDVVERPLVVHPWEEFGHLISDDIDRYALHQHVFETEVVTLDPAQTEIDLGRIPVPLD